MWRNWIAHLITAQEVAGLNPAIVTFKLNRKYLITKVYDFDINGLVAQLNSALDYGSRGYWFESSRGHETRKSLHTV